MNWLLLLYVVVLAGAALRSVRLVTVDKVFEHAITSRVRYFAAKRCSMSENIGRCEEYRTFPVGGNAAEYDAACDFYGRLYPCKWHMFLELLDCSFCAGFYLSAIGVTLGWLAWGTSAAPWVFGAATVFTFNYVVGHLSRKWDN